MRKGLLIVLAVVFLYSCADETGIPKGILGKEKMQGVLWDMIRVSEFLNTYVFLKDSTVDKTTESLLWYNKVYELHGVTKAEFEKSNDYYKTHPVLMKEIMDSLAKKYADPVNEASPETHQAPLIPSDVPASPAIPGDQRIDSIKRVLDKFPGRRKPLQLVADSVNKKLSQ